MLESEKLRWLLEPLGEGKAHVYIAIGENTKLTPAVEDAIRKLMAALQEQEDDVSGFIECGYVPCQGLGHSAVWDRSVRTDLQQSPSSIDTSLSSRVLGCEIAGMKIGM